MAAATLLAATAPAALAAEGPAPVNANDAAAVTKLIADLASTDYATRERAQRALETVPYGQIETLRKHATGIADAEARARMTGAIDRIEEIAITTVPPISIDVKDATLEQVASALGSATKTNIGWSGEGDRFTLKADQVPFWEVMLRLNAQHPLWFAGPDRRLVREAVGPVHITRGIAFFAFLEPEPAPFGVVIGVGAMADPRLKSLAMRPPALETAVDDAGRELVLTPGPGRPALANPPNWQLERYRILPADASAKTGTFRGTVKCMFLVSETSVELADAGKHLYEAIHVGPSTVTLRKMITSRDGDRVGLQLEITPDDYGFPPPPPPDVEITATGIEPKGRIMMPFGGTVVLSSEGSARRQVVGAAPGSEGVMRINVTDATGKAVAAYELPWGKAVTSVHAVGGGFKEPLKYTFTYPTRTREVTIPFEFKNLPLK